MKLLLVRLGAIPILASGLIFGLFDYAEAWGWSSENISFDFTSMKILFAFVGVTSTMLSITLVFIYFDVEQKMPSFFFLTSSVASLLFWGLLTGLVKL